MKRKWVCLAPSANADLAAGKLPSRIKLLSWGVNPSEIGDVLVNEQTLRALEAQIAEGVYAHLIIDFEHNSEKGHANFQKPPRDHAARRADLDVVGGDGVYLNAIAWTPAGQQYGPSYCDVSPTVAFAEDGKTVVAVRRAALCPNGALKESTFFSAEDGEDGAGTGRGAAELSAEEVVVDKLLMALRKALKLDAGATEEAIGAAVAALGARIDELGSRTATLAAGDGKPLTALEAELGTVKSGLVALQAQVTQGEKQAILARATREGKVVCLSAEVVAKLTVAELDEHVKKLPATVPVAQRTPDGMREAALSARGESTLTAEDWEMARRTGISLEAMGKATGLKVLGLVLALGLTVSQAFGTALTAARNTKERAGNEVRFGVYTNCRVFAGAMVALSNGYAMAAADAPALKVIGKATETVDNRVNAAGAGDSGALGITVRRGVFAWVNGDSFTSNNVGDLAYVEDDQTVQKASSATHDIIAGTIVYVDSDGVWVDTYEVSSQGVGSLSSLTVSGAASIGTTLAVSGASTLTGNLTVNAATLSCSNNATVTKALTVGSGVNVAGGAGITGIETNYSSLMTTYVYRAFGVVTNYVQVGP